MGLQQDTTVNTEKAKIDPLRDGASMIRLRWVWAAFICAGGIFSAALLLALNWRTMGYQRKATRMLVSIALAWAIGAFLTIRVTAYQEIDRGYLLRDDLRLIVILALQQCVAALIILWHSWPQWRLTADQPIAFRSDNRAFKAVGLGFLIGCLAWPIACWYVLLPAANFLSAPFTPDRVYTDQHITLRYPPYWQDRSDWFFDQLCRTNHKEHCLTFLIGDGAMLISDGGGQPPREHTFNRDWFDETTHFYKVSSTHLVINGREALRTTYTYVIYVGIMPLPMIADRVTINDTQASVTLELMAPRWMIGERDRILNSIHFLESPESVEE